MNGEFRVLIKSFDQSKIIETFKYHFTDNFSAAYDRSMYKMTGILKQSDFCFGYLTNNSLFLVYNREGDTMKVYIENLPKGDVNGLKTAIDTHFGSITRMLDKVGIRWKAPEATITLENHPLYGSLKTPLGRISDSIKKQKEKLFMVPIGSFVASFFAVQWNILAGDVGRKDMIKTLITTIEAYIGLVVLLITQVFLISNNRKFTFNF